MPRCYAPVSLWTRRRPPAGSAIDARNVIVVEQGLDLAMAIGEDMIDLGAQVRVVALHPDGYVVDHRPAGIVEPWRDPLRAQRHRRTRGEIAGERAPDQADVDLPCRHGA